MNAPHSEAAGLPRGGDIIAGKYQVEHILGRGGMGVVVAARHLALHQRVAIKLLRPSALPMPDALERFLREARAAAAIQSEHVAHVLDMGTLETGAPYMVMEYLQGTDLREVLNARKRLPVAEAVGIILQICEAIGEAHARGIVHRDLKPQNIFLITRAGAPFVKVLDFGLASVAAGIDNINCARLTATTTVIGSPLYMSPEQFQSLKRADARTDIWALGVILYQLIAGRCPFHGNTIASVYKQVRNHMPAPLWTYQPETPPWLDVVVDRCLEKDVANRIQSVAELVHGLTVHTQRPASFSTAPVVREVSVASAVASPVPWPRADAALYAPFKDPALESKTKTARHEQAQKWQGDPRMKRLALFTAAAVAVATGMLVASSMLWLRMRQMEAAMAAMTPAPAEPQAGTTEQPAGIVSGEERVLVEATAAPPAPASGGSPAVTASGVASARKLAASASSLPRISSSTPPPPRPAAATTATAKSSAKPAPYPSSELDRLNPYR